MRHVHYYEISGFGPKPALSSIPYLPIRVGRGQTMAISELGVNPQTGMEIVKVGIPTSASPSPQPIAAGISRTPPRGGGGTAVISGAYCETGWNDIFGITVGIVWDYVSFAYNGANISHYHTWGHVAAPFPDGDFFLADQSGQQVRAGSLQGWTNAIEDAPAFQNTQILWADNVVTAYPNGSVSGSARTAAIGPDKNLLGGWWQIVHS
jgi:hypothetical protein